MKILVLNGSPKSKSDTMVLTSAFLRGIEKNGQHEITIIDVIKKNISPCNGCFGCWQVGNGQCVIDDDQNEILKLYPEADLIIWSFPLYCYGMPSHLKAVLDRTIPLIQKRMEATKDGTRHVSKVDFSKIHSVVICGCGFPNYEHNFEGVSRQCELCFGNLTQVYVPETPLLNEPLAEPVAKIKIESFERAGEEYGKSLCLKPETITELQSLMIPKQDYINALNASAN